MFGAMVAFDMSLGMPQSATVSPVGAILREWRAVRRMSQLELALEAEVSTRHLSCVETGKSQPSREMIARLSGSLTMPLRELNTLLIAAGYAPGYPETALRKPALAQIRRAIDLILEHQEPYPAFVLDRHWDVLETNRAAVRVADFLIGGSAHSNMMLQFFDPNDMRAVVANWKEVARDLIRHLHDAVGSAPSDTKARDLLDAVLRYPGVPSPWNVREPSADPPPLLTVEFHKDGQYLRFFSTITTFGTANDVTLEELRIECTFPGDEATAAHCRSLAERDLG
jgi:transcriptional regulator with XRE-family HTH domain